MDRSEDEALSDRVYENLVSRLVSMQFSPGQHLSIGLLVDELGVSQTPVRAALMRLEAEGMVERRHNVGFSVSAAPSSLKLLEIYEVRSLLEPRAAALAAENARRRDIQTLADLCTEMKALSGGSGADIYGRLAILDRDFHDQIATIGGNETLKRAIDALHAHLHLFRAYHHSSIDPATFTEHQAIIEAVIARDADGAQEAMKNHIEESLKRLKPFLSQKGDHS